MHTPNTELSANNGQMLGKLHLSHGTLNWELETGNCEL